MDAKHVIAILAPGLLAALVGGCAATTPPAAGRAGVPSTRVNVEAGGTGGPAEPGAEPAAAVPGTVRQRTTGEVVHVNRETGVVQVRTTDGEETEVHVPPFALASVREGDVVSVDVTFTPR